MTGDISPELKIIKSVLRQRHLEQLKAHPRLVATPVRAGPPLYAAKDDIVQWSEESKAQISQGKANRVYGGPIGSPLDLNNAFLAFMASATVYLRDTSKVLDAVHKYHAGDVKEALRLLEDSTKAIDEIAALWVTFDLGEGEELGGRVARGIGRDRNQGPYFNLLHLLGISRDYPAMFSAGIHDGEDVLAMLGLVGYDPLLVVHIAQEIGEQLPLLGCDRGSLAVKDVCVIVFLDDPRVAKVVAFGQDADALWQQRSVLCKRTAHVEAIHHGGDLICAG
ncbi:hypothetical protein E4U43_006910, partial [Claviceps pusilla]